MTRKFSLVVAAVVPLAPLVPLLACGGDDNGGHVHVVDASMQGSGSGSGSQMITCTAASSNPTPTFGSAQSAETTGSGSSGSNARTVTYAGKLNNDPMPDLLEIDLYAGYGAFSGADITPKTVQLTGVEADYATCGACVLLLTDLHQGTGGAQITDVYMANAGTLTLTQTGNQNGGTLAGTLSNVTFRQVNIGQGGTTTDVGNCTSTLGSAAFSTTMTVGSAAFTGKIEGDRLILTHRRQ